MYDKQLGQRIWESVMKKINPRFGTNHTETIIKGANPEAEEYSPQMSEISSLLNEVLPFPSPASRKTNTLYTNKADGQV